MGRHVRILDKVWLDVDLADIGSNVEQEGKPADPCEELNSADFLDLWRQTLHRAVELDKERQDASLLGWWGSLKPWVSLSDAEARDGDGDRHGENCDDTENLELRVSKEAEVLGQVDIAREIAQNVAKSRHT